MALPSIINPAEQNRPAAQVKLEQEEEIYNKLYVKMSEDYVHKDDFNAWKEKFELKLFTQNTDLQNVFSALQTALTILDTVMATHTHVGAAPGSPVSPSGIISAPTVAYSGQPASEKLTDQLAKSYIDNSAVSGFDSSIERRKRSRTQLKPPLSAESV